MANTGYTRNLTFTVNDKQIKKATDRLFQSLDKIEKKIDQVVGKYNREVQVTYSASERVAKSVNTQLVAWKAVQETAKIAGGLVAAMYTGLLAVKGGVEGLVKWWQQLNETIGQTLQRQRKPLNELNAFVSKLRSEMEGYHSSSEKAKNTALQLASVIRVQVKEQAALNNLVNQGLGPVASGMRGRLPQERLGSRNRAFGRRYVGTPDEEAAKMRNRAINERRSRAIDARFWRRKARREKAEQLSAKQLLRLEQERLGIVNEQVDAKIEETEIARTNLEKLGFGKRADPKGAFASQRGMSGRWAGAGQSALIGGGFPLLFGQSPIAAVAGGAGGALGGLLGSGFGFAGSIVGTAIASEIEKVRNFRKAVRSLNTDLKNAGAITQYSRREIKQLGRDLDITKEEAIELAAAFSKFADVGGLDVGRLFGDRALFDATVGLNDFSSTLSRIQQLSEELTLEKEFEAYKILSKEGAEAANDFIVNSLIASKQTKVFGERFEEDLKRLDRVGKLSRNLRTINHLADITTFGEEFREVVNALIEENDEIQAILDDATKPFAQKTKEIDAILIPLIKDTNLLKEALKTLPDTFDLSTASAKQLVDALSENAKKLNYLAEFKAPDEELRKLLDPMRQVLDLSVAIRDGFSESFKGIIKGTMSVQDAFANMLNKIADHFLDFAAQIAAAQLQKGFLSLFSNMFTIKDGDIPPMKGRASGGPVRGGSPYIVGEKGPELFVPNSHGSIVPNHDLGGGANIVVNVDASGSSVEGDAGQAEELGSMLAAAVQAEILNQQRPGGLLAGTR